MNKTFINKNTSNSKTNPDSIGTLPLNGAGPDDQQAFMSILEKDANERYERRKQNNKIANELKEKGNEEFKNENYEKAIDFYTQAIQIVKDNPILYTNRAQVYIKLKNYHDAISDCDWALRAKENWLKAFIHKGRALTFLKKFDEALIEFQKAKELSPTQTVDGLNIFF